MSTSFKCVAFLLLMAMLGSLVCVSTLGADDEPFTFPSNMGFTGLLGAPTARLMKDERWRVGINSVRPYWYYYVTLTPLEGLEVNARMTRVEGYPALLPGYGDGKDKAVDIKYQILAESKCLPAIALGLLDPYGTRMFGAQYLVASKQIYPFDFTVGFGNGFFGKSPLLRTGGSSLDIVSNPKRWLSEGRFFYGVQFAPSDNFALALEYCPVDYEIQGGSSAADYFGKNPVSSKFNFGVRWRPFSWTSLDLSWQRGNQIGMGLALEFGLGKPFLPIYERPYLEPTDYARASSEVRIAHALKSTGFSSIGVSQVGTELWIDAENNVYFFTPQALKTIVSSLSGKLTSGISNVHIVLKQNGIPAVYLRAEKSDIDNFNAGTLNLEQLFYLGHITNDNVPVPEGEKHHQRRFDYGFKPIVRFFLNDPSGFLKYRLGLEATSAVRLWKGGSVVAGLSYSPVSTISTSNVPSPQAVHSDMVPYTGGSVLLEKLLFDQVIKGSHQMHVRGSAGILDLQYAGVDGEFAMPLFGGRMMVGLSASAVKKREAKSPFSLQDNSYRDCYSTAFVNTRINIPEQEFAIDIKAGQFLAGDRGGRVTVSKFYNGLVLYAWYGMTDTSMFEDDINRGYRDIGVGVSIPLRFFQGAESRTTYSFVLSPWTRDVAQDIDHYNSLFDYMGRNMRIYIDRDAEGL